jgi:hypothetical protein
MPTELIVTYFVTSVLRICHIFSMTEQWYDLCDGNLYACRYGIEFVPVIL